MTVIPPTNAEMAKAEAVITKLVSALHAVLPLLDQAKQAYQFAPTAYSYEAMLACGRAHDLAWAAIKKAVPPPAPDDQATPDAQPQLIEQESLDVRLP